MAMENGACWRIVLSVDNGALFMNRNSNNRSLLESILIVSIKQQDI